MGVVEVLLALFGLLCLVMLAWAGISAEARPPGEPEDLAGPYREGLRAAVRMQKVAADLEQQIYAEAARHGRGG